MPRSRIHLIGPAGSCRTFLQRCGCETATALCQLVDGWMGGAFEVTADEALLLGEEDETRGGRSDDVARARDIEAALGDDGVVALVTLRGGAWFTRVLPGIDFSVLDRRNMRVAVIGFSELTTLVNIVGAHANGVGIYDMGPAFLAYGLRHHALSHPEAVPAGATAEDWAVQRFLPELGSYFRDIAGILRRGETQRRVMARWLRGRQTAGGTVRFTGGNLTVLSTLCGSRYDLCARPRGGWLMLEDYNDKVERLDRFLAHLTLCGWWVACAGILLGDFHQGDRDLCREIAALLEYHLPDRDLPILTTRDVGHIWPMAPLPLHVDVTFDLEGDGTYHIGWRAPALLP